MQLRSQDLPPRDDLPDGTVGVLFLCHRVCLLDVYDALNVAEDWNAGRFGRDREWWTVSADTVRDLMLHGY